MPSSRPNTISQAKTMITPTIAAPTAKPMPNLTAVPAVKRTSVLGGVWTGSNGRRSAGRPLGSYERPHIWQKRAFGALMARQLGQNGGDAIMTPGYIQLKVGYAILCFWPPLVGSKEHPSADLRYLFGVVLTHLPDRADHEGEGPIPGLRLRH